MVYMKSMRKLILESNMRDLYEKEESDNREHMDHKKNIFDIIDTITIISAEDSTILQMDWSKFESKFENLSENSLLDVNMLRTIMQTNLSDYLINIPVFEGLSNSKLEILSRLCHYSVEKNGAVICKEGDRGEEVFVLLSGEVKVEAMASKRMVELFEEGILSPLEKTTSFSSTSENQRSELDSYKRKGSVNFKCDYERPKGGQNSFIRRRQTLLQAGRSCRREKVKMTISALKEKENEQEDLNLRRISRLDIPDPNHTVELARFKQGDYFGEISTFIELPRAATVTATSNVLMVSISKQSFRTLYHCISPNLEKDIEAIVKQHMLQTLLQSKSPFLEVINTEDAKSWSDLSTIRTVEEGETIFREGDEADKFYFVYSGQLSVLKTSPLRGEDGGEEEMNKEMVIGTLYAGDYFGEMALLNNSKRLATIVSNGTSVLIAITRENFYTCFQETPQLIAEFIVRMKGSKVDLESLLKYSKSRVEFSKFLNSIQSYALSCYEEIEAFECEFGQSLESPEKSLADQAKCIIDKYFKDGASHFVDLGPSSIAQIDNIQSAHDLNNVKVALENLMEKDLLPKFKESNSFDLLRERMRWYDDIDAKLLA